MTSILPWQIQLVALTVLLAFLGWVLWLIRSQRLQLRESLIWLVTTVLALAVTAYPKLLVVGARLLGVQVPSNALFGAGLFYLAVNVLSITIAVSGDSARLRRLTQECALLRAELEDLRASRGGRPPTGGAPPAA